MTTFFQLLDRGVVFSDEDYCARQPTFHKQAAVLEMLISGKHAIAGICALARRPLEIPYISVREVEELQAEGSEYGISITSGLFDWCLSLEHPPIAEIIGYPLSEVLTFEYYFIPSCAFSWIVAHEYYHGLRKHNELIRRVGSDQLTLYAIEYDADLCAAAGIYRSVQLNYRGIWSDCLMRRAVFGALFWFLRSMPEELSGHTHPNFLVRIYLISMKLAQIMEGPGVPDQEFERHDTRARADDLINILILNERLYRAWRGGGGNPYAELQSVIASSEHGEIVSRWDEIRDIAAEVSGMPA